MSADDLTETLAAMRATAEAATEGPWAIWHDLDHQGFRTVGDAESYQEILDDGMTEECNPTAHVYTDEDAEFIAQSRTIVPALLSAVENVLAAKPKPEGPFHTEAQDYYIDGYNEALRVVRKALTDALGGA